MKRLLDFLIASFSLLVLSPLFALVALLIWLQDLQSPFYVAPRVGKSGESFPLIKFRSMVVGADRSGVDSTSASDPRITRLGAVLRSSKLDELPQLWNVLRGQMSFVGPRPQVERDVLLYTEKEQKLLTIQPGITDLASIVFADEGEILRDCFDPDLEYNRLIRPWKSRLGLIYVENQSLKLDLRLIFFTALVLISWSWALKGVYKILRSLDAGETLIRVCKRKDPLVPYPPPGSSQIVVERTSKPPKPNST